MAAVRLGALCLAMLAAPALGEVESLTSKSFYERIQGDIVLVKFFAPWCGHCREMAPAYEEAAKELANHGVHLAEVDGTKEPNLAEVHGVTGFPTLKIYRKGHSSEYQGPRDAAGIVQFMKDQVGVSGIGPSTGESPLLMAKLCRGQKCDKPGFPLIEYSEAKGECLCSEHPCWNDDGQAHACEDAEFPHLVFFYTTEGVLECGCRKEPHYQSKYIAKEKCPGHHCEDDEFPILDFNPEDNKCLCRAHPCHDVEGVKHGCDDDKFPILHYREEEHAEGGFTPVCECKAKMEKKADEEL